MILQAAQHERVGGNDSGSFVRLTWRLVQNPLMAKQYKGLTDSESRAFDERLLSYEQRAAVAQGKAAQAFGRLLNLAETRDSGQARSIAHHFIAASYNLDSAKFPVTFPDTSLESIDHQHLLRAMDALVDHKAEVDSVMARLLRPLVDQDLAMVFYDMTTIRAGGLSEQEGDGGAPVFWGRAHQPQWLG